MPRTPANGMARSAITTVRSRGWYKQQRIASVGGRRKAAMAIDCGGGLSGHVRVSKVGHAADGQTIMLP
jgi:hypothetical protein